ncbi:MAG: T9SS type A sorting domain-containing protein [Crocinitomicaceae bacterium]|nr:T9SS type A sorting domain-containing protein [Crocinitomicaceae bacterium]
MKKLLLSTSALFMCFSFVGFSQQIQQIKSKTFNETTFLKSDRVEAVLNGASRSMTCTDTISYPLYKEMIMGSVSTMSSVLIANVTGYTSAISQTFHASAPGLTISKVEIYGNNDATYGDASATVRVSIYNVDASNNPIGSALGSGTVNVSSTTGSFYYVNLSSPITVTSNYAVVVEAATSGDVFEMWCNNSAPGQQRDEDLSRYKDTDYPSWTPIPSVDFGGVYDFEPLVGPVVSYTINTTSTVTPTTACLGDQVNLNNTTSNFFLSNRMYNMNVLETHFNLSSNDSTYVWAPDGTDLNNLIWQKNTNYTYPSAGSFNAVAYSLGGLSHTCLDNTTKAVTINPVDNPAFNYASSTVCAGSGNISPASVSTPGGTFSSTVGLVFANATTGEINIAGSTPGTYTITYNTNGTCSASSTQQLTITSAPNASFTYGAASYCANGTNPIPNVTGSIGTFSSTAGLSINASTGEINLAASTPGATYTVTNTINTPGCPVVTDQYDVTINAVDNASFAYSASTFCAGSGNPIPSSIATAGGTFSSTAGLVFVSTSTGEIDLAGSTLGNYSVTYTTNGVCPNTSTQSVSIVAAPNAAFTYGQASYCNNESNPSPVITGTAGTFSSTGGLSINGSTGVINLAASTPSTYTVTNTVTVAGCPSATDNFSITIVAAPDATVVLNDKTLTASTPGASYQWYDCSNNQPVAGATSQSFTPTTPGSYKVTINNGSCSSTSTCQTVTNAGIDATDLNAVRIYPNPAENHVIIEGLTSNALISVVDLNGKVLSEANFATTVAEVSLTNFVSGVYFIKIQSETINGITKVVKK